MPQNIINKLQNQNNLAKDQETIYKVYNALGFWQRLSQMDIDLIYIPDILHDFPWDTIDTPEIWQDFPNQKDIKQYLYSMHCLKYMFKQLNKYHAVFCLRLKGIDSRTAYVPLIKESLKQYIIDYCYREGMPEDTIQAINNMLDNSQENDLSYYDVGDSEYAYIKNLIQLYQITRIIKWHNYFGLSNWLSQKLHRLYIADSSPFYGGFSVSSKYYKPISLFSVNEYLRPDNWFKPISGQVSKKQIMDTYLNGKDLDNIYYHDKPCLLISRVNSTFTVNPDEYQICDLHFKPCKLNNYQPGKIDTFVVLDKNKLETYMFDSKNQVMLKI